MGIHGHLEVAKKARRVMNFVNDDGRRMALQEAFRLLSACSASVGRSRDTNA
jgi:hypothetical protein